MTIEKKRYAAISNRFEEIHGQKPEYFVRAPGRVNLIGEHIDYCGYSVLPMAVFRDIVIACGTSRDSQLQVANTDPEFMSTSRAVSEEMEINAADGGWWNYVLCAAKGVVNYAKTTQPVGINMLVDGTIPKGAGLSSSSALVCASAIAVARANNLKIDPTSMADICIKSEKFVGLDGGGMDQAICMLAEPGFAKHITFKPLTATSVKLPNDIFWVISDSRVSSHKRHTAVTNYNLRVVECRLAAQLVAKKLGVESWASIRTLSEAQQKAGLTLDEMFSASEKYLHGDNYSTDELQSDECFGGELSSLIQGLSHAHHVLANTLSFTLRSRAMQVYSEARRVEQFRETCDDSGMSNQDKIKILSTLLNESHNSCRDWYECSCMELDKLQEACLSAGALGSRLTGAGWGGCVVSLVPADRLSNFMARLTEQFYAGVARVDEYLFASEPTACAGVQEMK
eukprot:331729_1